MLRSSQVHGTSAHDEMVHRFTHRVARGVLMLLGRPDGRILSLLKTEIYTQFGVDYYSYIVLISNPH